MHIAPMPLPPNIQQHQQQSQYPFYPYPFPVMPGGQFPQQQQNAFLNQQPDSSQGHPRQQQFPYPPFAPWMMHNMMPPFMPLPHQQGVHPQQYSQQQSNHPAQQAPNLMPMPPGAYGVAYNMNHPAMHLSRRTADWPPHQESNSNDRKSNELHQPDT